MIYQERFLNDRKDCRFFASIRSNDNNDNGTNNFFTASYHHHHSLKYKCKPH